MARFLDGGSGRIGGGGGKIGGGTPGTTTGTSTLPSNAPPANPFSNENGGVSANTWYLFVPVQDITTGNSYIGFFDITSFDDPRDDSSYSFRKEDVIPLRQPTVRRIGLIYRDLGPAALTVTLSATNDNAQVITSSTKIQIGNKVPTNDLMVTFADLTLTGFHPQITLSRKAGDGPVSVVSVTMIGEVEDATP